LRITTVQKEEFGQAIFEALFVPFSGLLTLCITHVNQSYSAVVRRLTSPLRCPASACSFVSLELKTEKEKQANQPGKSVAASTGEN
jgi:hypothetical protein